MALDDFKKDAEKNCVVLIQETTQWILFSADVHNVPFISSSVKKSWNNNGVVQNN